MKGKMWQKKVMLIRQRENSQHSGVVSSLFCPPPKTHEWPSHSTESLGEENPLSERTERNLMKDRSLKRMFSFHTSLLKQYSPHFHAHKPLINDWLSVTTFFCWFLEWHFIRAEHRLTGNTETIVQSMGFKIGRWTAIMVNFRLK